MKCEDRYLEVYGRDPEGLAFCPYRISPLGAHIDHQYGKINGLAIDKGIHLAYGKKQNGVVELTSINFPKRAQFHIREIPEEKVGDWADHLRGAAKVLSEKYPLKYGLSGVIEGGLPIGGLSSSASVIIVFLTTLAAINNILLEPWETIMMAKKAENEYVGVNCGKLDQCCEVLSRANHLLYLDCKDDSYELIPTPENMPPYSIAVFFSGLERSLTNSKYNLRQDECKAAAYNLLAHAGMDYGKFVDTRLRDVPEEVANVKENFTRYGKQSLTLFGKQFFTSFGKDNFTLPGKEFFHLLWVAGRQPSGKHIRVLQPVGLTAE